MCCSISLLCFFEEIVKAFKTTTMSLCLVKLGDHPSVILFNFSQSVTMYWFREFTPKSLLCSLL